MHNPPNPPLFGGAYVLVQVHAQPIALHRLRRVKTGHEFTSDVSVSTLEYEQVVCEGGGLFGMWAPKMDPQFSRGQGLKFLRHEDIRRSSIKLYDVKTFDAPDGKLYIALTDLQKLSTTCPEYVLPNPIPASHRAFERQAGGGAGQPGEGRGQRGGAGRGAGGRSGTAGEG